MRGAKIASNGRGAAILVTTQVKGGEEKRLTTGHGGLMAPIKGQTKRQEDTPLPPKEK
jgi:hypothetical protein